MTEITLNLDDPGRAVQAIRYVVAEYLDKQREEGMVGEGANAPILDRIADSIEEQVKQEHPSEPKEFGSIARAGFDEHSPRVLWQRNSKGGWNSEDGSASFWTYLHKPEVVRDGLGVSSVAYHRESWRNGYQLGIENTRDRITRRLEGLKRDLITSVEKTAIDKAIAKVEEDAADTVYGRGCPS